jgi:hypothetical protein
MPGLCDPSMPARAAETSAGFYRASPVKRDRATKAEFERHRESLFEIVAAMRPMTVRQVFYQATVRGIAEKSEARYSKVQTYLVLMRRAGEKKDFGETSVELDAIEGPAKQRASA